MTGRHDALDAYRFGASASRSRPSPHDVRLLWLELIGQALTTAFAAGAGTLDQAARTALARVLIRARPCAFPVPFASAQALAKGFLEHVSGLTTATRPEDQARLAEVVTPAAKGLSALIAESQAEVAQATWMKQIPEGDR